MIDVQETPSGIVVNLTQERLDITIANSLLQNLGDIITKPPKGIILNLRHVNYMDSAVLGVLVNFQKKIKDAGKTLVVTGLSPAIKKVFQLTKLDKFFKIQDV